MMAIQFTNLKPVICPASSDLNIDVDRILSLITPRTKIVSIVSPSNPTGHVYSSDSLKSLQEALYNKGIWYVFIGTSSIIPITMITYLIMCDPLYIID